MKKFTLLSTTGFLGLLFLLIFNLESCSSHKGIASCPDLRNTAHHLMTMHVKGNHQPAVAKVETPKIQTDNYVVAKPSDATASISSDITKVKTSKQLFSILTSDERQQVRDHFSSAMAKKPVMKKMALNKWDEMDAKYPAPAQSVIHPGGGGLTLGEILAIVAIACAVTWVLGIAGLIIGIIALLKIKNDGSRNWAKILAIVAIVLGAIDLITFIVWIALYAIALHAATVGII